MLIDYRFGIASLSNKKELLQVNDPVQFNADLNEEFAMNIHATREKLRAMVEAMKGKLFFEIKDRFTPPIPEIIWVKNVKAIVVCGFLMKYLNKIYLESFKRIMGTVWKLPAK